MITALGVVRIRNLFAAVMLTGIYSLLSACIFTMLDAVDVAFTEAAVGAGISTVLMLGTLSLTQRKEKVHRQTPVLALVVVLLTGATLFYAITDTPALGDPNAPIHTYLAPDYIRMSIEAEIPNVVTTVLASYRGYDTFGETTVIFTAGVGVMLLLWRFRDEEEQDGDPSEAETGEDQGGVV